jgi:adenine-specific DNA-methyltransferase
MFEKVTLSSNCTFSRNRAGHPTSKLSSSATLPTASPIPVLRTERITSAVLRSVYKNICEIGKERIRRAGAKIKAEAGLMAQNIDMGFRVFKLDETNMKDVFYSAEEYTQTLLDGLISNIKEDRTDLDLLYGCLLEWGLPLSLPHMTEAIEGCNVHTVNDGDLIACFDENIPESVIKKIAERKPLRAVFRDSSFASSPEKINVTEIFKLMAPGTSVRVI